MAPGPHNLLPTERRSYLLAVLERRGSMRASELAAELGTSDITVRRDITRLATEGRLVRVHGGAVAAASPPGENLTGNARIGVLVPSLAYYWPSVIESLETEARRRRCTLFLRAASYDAMDERPVLDGLVAHDRIDGLIMAPRTDGPGSGALARWIDESAIPTVLIERELSTPAGSGRFDSVMSDHALGTVTAVRHLADLGHRRVGIVLSRHSPTARRMATGWRAACAELGLANDEHFERLVSTRTTTEFTLLVDDLVAGILSSGTTGLLVNSDPEAFAVVQNALERGLDVPGDLSVIAYDDVMAESLSPALTAVRPPREAVARTAVHRLLELMGDPGAPSRRTLISPVLYARESTGPAPGGERHPGRRR